MAILLLSQGLCGQSVLDSLDPNANGTVRVVVVQPDGNIVIGGIFTTLSPNGGAAVTRNRIARLNAAGTLDTAFDPNANGTIRSIVLQSDGKILIGGEFTTLSPNGGAAVTRNRIARLNPDGTLDTSFDPNAPNASDRVETIAVQADGKILAGGFFTTIGGQTRNNIARLDSTTGLADSFDPNADADVFSIALQADGKILVGGIFTNIGGQARNRIARLDPATGLADSFDPNASGTVNAIAVQADGNILVGGAFTGVNSIGGQTRQRIARLDPATGLADSFDPNANLTVLTIAVQADGKILVGGTFNDLGAGATIGGQIRNRIARLDPATGLADSFDPNANNTVFSIAQQADGKILVAGFYTTLAPNGGAPVTRNRIARFTDLKILSIMRADNDHTILQCLGISNQINNLQVSPDLSAGSFTTIMPPPPAADGTGAFQYDDANAVGLTKRFYRLTFP